MPDSSAPAQSPVWDFLKSPAVGQSIILVVTFLIGIGTTLTTQWVRSEPARISLPAADPPKPTPLTSMQDLENVLGSYGARIDKRFDAVDKRLEDLAPRVAPSKVRPLK